MVHSAEVQLFGHKIGIVSIGDAQHAASFQYIPQMSAYDWNPSPLMMPVNTDRVYTFPTLSEHTFKGLPGMLADSLPDSFGRKLLDRWLSMHNRLEASPIEMLCFQGKRGMGALTYEPSREEQLEESEVIEMDGLVEAAKKALSIKEELDVNLSDREKALLEIIKVGTSAGGQRAKAVIALNDATGEVRSGQIDAPEGFDYWLLKFDGFDANGTPMPSANFGRREYAFHRCVMASGIQMSECRLLEENGRAHFLTKRFDRAGGRKLHMQTLCGIAHFDFNNSRSYSYEQALMVMRRMNLTYPEMDELYRRMVFNVMALNRDDHTKNISFLMDESGHWHLSPAYDMGFSYNPAGRFTREHQMSLQGKTDGITRKDLLDFADHQGIANAPAILEQVQDAVMQFPTYAAEAGVPRDETEAIMSVIREKMP